MSIKGCEYVCIGRVWFVNGSSVNVQRRKKNDRFVKVYMYAW
jgi:hypothetical protein